MKKSEMEERRQVQKERFAWMFAVILFSLTMFAPGSIRAKAMEVAQTAEKVSAQTVTSSSFELPSYELRELTDGTISYTSAATETRQIACEEQNGIYLLSGKILSLYSLETGKTEQVYTFTGDTDAYAEGGYLYVVYQKEVYIYDLVNRELSQTITIQSGYTGLAVGADTTGRIYVAAYTSTSSGTVYEILLYSAGGTLLSSCETGVRIYSFGGFDSTNGYYYVEGYYNWVYGGFSHPGKSMMHGVVTNNTIAFDPTSFVFLCQSSYYFHQDGIALLGDKYIVAASVTYGGVYIWNSNEKLTSYISFGRKAIDYTLSNTYYDTTSIGVRAVYNEWRGSIILYDGGKVLTEYDPVTKEELAQFETQHYVFNILQMGDTLLVIEKENNVYYLEIIDWSEPGMISVFADSTTLKVGEAEQLTVDTGTHYSMECSWSSSDNTIASVTDTGRVVAWSEGTVTITVSILDGEYTATIQVKVTASEIETPMENAVTTGGTVSNNVSDNYYSVHGSTVKSYLFENDDGTLTRVEYISGTGVLVEIYSTDYELKSSLVLEAELSIFGGFYAGTDYHFLVFGQKNTAESDECEVVRIVKYDKNWNRVSQCSICGANTYIPFDAGSLRMTETGGSLYLYSCHEMYMTSDGYHHQANMTFVVDESSMKVTDSYYEILNIAQAGYVSHSFNQYIQTDGSYIYRVDHGDAGPRAVSITKASASGSITSVSYTLALKIQGETGNNATGVSVGGFEISTDNLLIVGNSVDQSDADTYSASGQRNIFLTVTDKDLDATEVIWLTDYASEDGITPRTPQLVKLNDDHFLILWEEYSSTTKKTLIKAVTVDGDGQVTSEITTLKARLSDVQPIVISDGLVKWYVTDGTNMTIYVLNAYDLFASSYLSPDVENTETGVQVSFEASSNDIAYYEIYRKAGNGSYALVKTTTDTVWLDTGVAGGTVYTYQICAYTAKGHRVWSEEVLIRYLTTPELTEVCNVNGGIQVTWKEVTGATGYYIYYKKSASTSWSSKTVETGGGEELSYTLNSLVADTFYDIYVQAFADGDRSVASKQETIRYLKAPVVSLAEADGGISVSWSTVTGAEGYQVYRKDSEESYQLVATTTELSVTDTGVKSGETYMYQVFAYAGGILSGGSTEKSRMYLCTPVMISVSNGTNGISLTWEATEGAEKYYVYYKNESSSSYSYGYVNAGDGSTQGANLTASSGYTYSIYIKAYAEGYYSAATEVFEQYYLKRPTVTLSTDESGNSLTWSAITGAASYVIYRKAANGEYSQVKTTTDTFWTDVDIADGVTYTYQVFAYANGTYSAGSEEKSGGKILITDCTITLSSTSYTYNGVEKTPTVTVKYGSTRLTKDTHYTVAYSNNKNAGTATVTVTGLGKYTGTATADFTINKASQTISASISSTYIQVGNTATIMASGIGTIIFASADTSIATVSSDGVVTGRGYGQTTITVTASGNENYAEASRTFTVNITGLPLSVCTVELNETSFVYDGTEKRPAVTVTYGSLALAEGTDYTLSYSSNVNAGTATVTVTGMGTTTGTVKKYFTIEKAEQKIFVDRETAVRVDSTVSLGAVAQGTLSYTSKDPSIAAVSSQGVVTGVTAGTVTITVTAAATANYSAATATVIVSVTRIPLSECEVTIDAAFCVYDGAAKEPAVTVKYGTSALIEETDYFVSYSDNMNAGTATVTVTGEGNYEGELEKTFTISKAEQILAVSIDSTDIFIGATAQITASGKGTISYTSGDTSVAMVSVSGLVTGIDTGRAEITVSASGNKNYNAATRTIQVTVKEKVIEIADFKVTLSASSYIYDGMAKTPTVTVKTTEGVTLKKGTDYTVSYANNTNPGTATVTITGIGDYSGTITATFAIKLAGCSVSYINNTMDGFKVVWTKVDGASGYYIYRRNDDGTYSPTPTASAEGGETTEWIDPLELVGAKDYTYKVAAYYEDATGNIIVGSSGTTKTCKYLKGGEVESVENTSSGPKVTWIKVDGANGYYIFRKAAGESDYTQVATVTVRSTSTLAWTDTEAHTSGKNYTYKVSAIFTNSKGQVTKGGAKVTKTVKYLDAGKISDMSNTSDGVYIRWSKVTGVTGYYVYRKASSASGYTLVKTITSVGTVSYTDTAVKSNNNITYTYYIQPYFKNSSGAITKAGYSTKAIVRLVAPTISSLTNSAAKTLTVKWGTKSGVTGYQVQYSTSSSFAGGNKTLTVTGASSSSKTVSSLTKGKTYYVRIRTYKTVNGTKYYSAWCTVKSVKISK